MNDRITDTITQLHVEKFILFTDRQTQSYQFSQFLHTHIVFGLLRFCVDCRERRVGDFGNVRPEKVPQCDSARPRPPPHLRSTPRVFIKEPFLIHSDNLYLISQSKLYRSSYRPIRKFDSDCSLEIVLTSWLFFNSYHFLTFTFYQTNY